MPQQELTHTMSGPVLIRISSCGPIFTRPPAASGVTLEAGRRPPTTKPRDPDNTSSISHTHQHPSPAPKPPVPHQYPPHYAPIHSPYVAASTEQHQMLSWLPSQLLIHRNPPLRIARIDGVQVSYCAITDATCAGTNACRPNQNRKCAPHSNRISRVARGPNTASPSTLTSTNRQVIAAI